MAARCLQVHYMWPNGQGSRILDILPRRPTYRELLDLLKRVAGTRSSRSWVDRVLSVKLPLLYDGEWQGCDWASHMA